MITIRKVVALKQKAPAIFEVRVQLQDGTPATIEVSTLALADLVERGTKIFRRAP